MAGRGIDWIDVAATAFLLGAAATVAFAEGSAARLSANETAAIATLRNLATCQAQLQTTGKIDCDADGIGEYGTFLELTGTVGVRKGLVAPKGKKGDEDFSVLGSNFKKKGAAVSPPVLSPALANVDVLGYVSHSGYALMLFLPDTADPAWFTHEKGPPLEVSLTAAVGVDLSETTWCAYAQPVALGESGNRRFFVNQSGDVMQSANVVARSQGFRAAIKPDSAFRGDGITSRVAVGTSGNDGDVWKVTN